MKERNLGYKTTFIVLLSAFGFVLLFAIHALIDSTLKARLAAQRLELITSVIDTEFDENPLENMILINSADGKEKLELYPIRQNGVINSVVIRVGNPRGYGGYLEILVGFYTDGTISRYKVITHNETIGLGSKITEEKFAEQFQYANPERMAFKVTKDGGDLDAITSATISSRAVIDAIQKAFDAYQRFIVGE
ncbi:MAG: RnfABCDGE type electron transport complex subunit G [Alphaproteobacteria bacterium]|nr:RnfABCDGE type electron transport complex subunit G [Alphaproteobacteria bacterium]